MTKVERVFFIVTFLIALAIHPAMDFTDWGGFIIWGAVSIAGFIAMLAVAFGARSLGFPIRGIVVGAGQLRRMWVRCAKVSFCQLKTE